MSRLERLPARDAIPWWARTYRTYESSLPNHWGKRTVLRLLRRVGCRGKAFLWRVNNGTLVAIDPSEGDAPWSVGWTCFAVGEWEPHLEAFLRRSLAPGDVAWDVGANLGYFSAVMAQCVGPAGRVVAFEPVPPTYERLCQCKLRNGFSQMTTFQLALGAAQGFAQIRYDPRLAGSASLHHENGAGLHAVTVRVAVCDELVARGMVPPPRLIKVDVEGHERDVLRGARRTLMSCHPVIVFEYNRQAAANAGWTLGELLGYLRECADYDFYGFEHGALGPLDERRLEASAASFTDLVATCRRPD
jgi:FkbM family methyltransferase